MIAIAHSTRRLDGAAPPPPRPPPPRERRWSKHDAATASTRFRSAWTGMDTAWEGYSDTVTPLSRLRSDRNRPQHPPPGWGGSAYVGGKRGARRRTTSSGHRPDRATPPCPYRSVHSLCTAGGRFHAGKCQWGGTGGRVAALVGAGGERGPPLRSGQRGSENFNVVNAVDTRR